LACYNFSNFELVQYAILKIKIKSICSFSRAIFRDMIEVICVEAGFIMTNCYVVIDNNNNNTIVVDTALESADLLFDIVNKRKLNVVGIILTHTHWDHSGDANLLRKLTGAPVMVHRDDEYRLLKPNENTVMMLPVKIEECIPDRYLSDSEIISFGDLEFEVRHTPGHTEGGICLVHHKEKIAFVGDTIFNQSIGRTDLPGGSTETLIKSINDKIMTLSDDYLLYSGHGPSTTVGDERLYNPFLNMETEYFNL
jgi:glyoxylase-like metal-dependent hydrolase (beta-lactamase superfamily II)